MNGMIILGLNIALAVFIVLGFLFGLKGVKKAGLSLGFFVVSLLITTLITPLISSALLQIQIPYNGTNMSFSEIIISYLKQQPIMEELYNNGASMEAFINNAPQIIGNLITFIALVYVVGLLFWIGYLITAHFIFKKDKKKKKEKNPISKTAPSNVTATGDVKYVKEEPKVRKFRWLGGLVGAVHGFILLIATLLPVSGVIGIVNELAYAENDPSLDTTVSITTTANNEANTDAPVDTPPADVPDVNLTSDNLTPSAKLLQQNLNKDGMDVLKEVSDSAIIKVCTVVDFTDVWFNSIAKCRVNGQKIVLKDEVVNIAKVYDNVEFLSSMNLQSADDLKAMNFNKLRTAVGCMFDSNVLTTLAPDVINSFIEWMTTEDITSLKPEVQEMIKPMHDLVSTNDNLKEFVDEIKVLFKDNKTMMDTLKTEALSSLDILELLVKSDLVTEIIKTDGAEVDANVVINALRKNNYELINNIIDKVFNSRLNNLGILTGINQAIDALSEALQSGIDPSLKIDVSKIKLSLSKSKIDTKVLKDIVKFVGDCYVEFNTVGFENIKADLSKIITENFENNLKGLGKVLDSIVNAEILNEFKTMDGVINLLKDAKIFTGSIKDYVDLNSLNLPNFSFADEFYNISSALKPLLSNKVVEGVEPNQTSTPVIEVMLNGEISKALEVLTDQDINLIIDTLSSSALFKPTSVKIINELNKQIQNAIGGTPAGDLLPEDIDLSTQTEEIKQVVSDAVTLMPELESVKNGEKTLDDVVTNPETQKTVTSLLENLETNATNDGVFADVYTSMVEYVKDEKNGLTNIATIIDHNTTTLSDNTSDINWEQVLNDYITSKGTNVNA